MVTKYTYHQGLSYVDCFIRVYQSFTAISYKCMNIAINVFYIIISYYA